jgi:hypothetical protein
VVAVSGYGHGGRTGESKRSDCVLCSLLVQITRKSVNTYLKLKRARKEAAKSNLGCGVGCGGWETGVLQK